MNTPLKGVLLSSFNADNLAALLANDPGKPKIEMKTAPYDQVAPVLLGASPELWEGKPDFAVVWTEAEAVIGSYRALRNYEQVSEDLIEKEVNTYAGLLEDLLKKVRFVFVPTWIRPADEKIFGMLEMKPSGAAYALARMNCLLAKAVERHPGIILLDSQRWIAGRSSYSPKSWYLGKIPYGLEVFKEAAHDLKASLKVLSGGSRKLIVVDLDDTIWGGLVGEDGWKNLKVGGHDPIGEAYADFQEALKSLTRRGVLLAIVSKNEESVALEAIRMHPEMILREKDFAGWKINWKDKTQNIRELAAELRLGLDAIVFIDDSPQERSAIRQTLPEVEVPEWPEDKMLYKKALLGLGSIDSTGISREDSERNGMAAVERLRGGSKKDAASLDEWLESLEIRVAIEPLSSANLQRAVQLLNKTNQMNLSTRRMIETELLDWSRNEGRCVLTFRAADKFGDAGLIGLMSLEREGDKAMLVDFLLSCRVIGRKIEESMLHIAAREVRTRWNSAVLYARFFSTPKNAPCFEFWKRSGFSYDQSKNLFSWDARKAYPLPKAVRLSEGVSA